MIKRVRVIGLVGILLGWATFTAQAQCGSSSAKLACVIPQEYGPGAFSAAGQGVFANNDHEGHFDNSIGKLLCSGYTGDRPPGQPAAIGFAIFWNSLGFFFKNIRPGFQFGTDFWRKG